MTLLPLLISPRFSPDVVPVEPTTHDDWTHPPYSGHFDGSLLRIPLRYRS